MDSTGNPMQQERSIQTVKDEVHQLLQWLRTLTEAEARLTLDDLKRLRSQLVPVNNDLSELCKDTSAGMES